MLVCWAELPWAELPCGTGWGYRLNRFGHFKVLRLWTTVMGATVGQAPLNGRTVAKPESGNATELFAFTKAPIRVFVETEKLAAVAIVESLITEKLEIFESIKDIDKTSLLALGVAFGSPARKLLVQLCRKRSRPIKIRHRLTTAALFTTQAAASFQNPYEDDRKVLGHWLP